MKTKLYILLALILILGACRKKFDEPPYLPVNDGARLTISQLKNRCANSNSYHRFGSGDTNLYCLVTMDETSGNIYKQVYVRDEAGWALQIRLLNSGGLYLGDKIRINLNKLFLISANNMVYLDSVDLEKSVVKLSSGNAVPALSSSISKILNANSSPTTADNLQSQLVEINSAEFIYSARGKTFANAIGKTAYEYMLTDCANKQISVRTSGMANFANKLVPEGNGKIIGVLQQYDSEMTLIIRNYNELHMSAPPCLVAPTYTGTAYLTKDFNDNSVLSGGWTLASVTGTTSWTSSNLGQSNYYARVYNKNGTIYEACESWLISPSIDLSLAIDPHLNFSSANSSTTSPFALMISTDYESGAAHTANWMEIPFTRPNGNFTFVNSGDISLSEFKNKNMHLAFKYSGTSSSGSIWEVDNILVREK